MPASSPCGAALAPPFRGRCSAATAALPCPDHDAKHRPLEKAGLYLRSLDTVLRSSRADVSQVPPQAS
jgi:hypothetical protein